MDQLFYPFNSKYPKKNTLIIKLSLKNTRLKLFLLAGLGISQLNKSDNWEEKSFLISHVIVFYL